MRLWTKKAEQLHEKAEMLFPGDKIAEQAYQEILKDSDTVKKKLKIRLFMTIGAIIAFIVFASVCGENLDTNQSGNIKENKKEMNISVDSYDIEKRGFEKGTYESRIWSKTLLL